MGLGSETNHLPTRTNLWIIDISMILRNISKYIYIYTHIYTQILYTHIYIYEHSYSLVILLEGGGGSNINYPSRAAGQESAKRI